MHLKNFSLFTDADGLTRLTPVYDQVCTELVIPNDPLALPVLGKRDRLDADDWQRFATDAELPPRFARRELDRLRDLLPEALELVSNSYLPDEQKMRLQQLLRDRTAQF